MSSQSPPEESAKAKGITAEAPALNSRAAAIVKVHLESTDIAYSSDNHYKDKRTAMITAEVRTEEDLDKLDEFFADASEKDDMIYIRGL